MSICQNGGNSDVSQTWWMKWARNLHVALIVLLLLSINFKLNFKGAHKKPKSDYFSASSLNVDDNVYICCLMMRGHDPNLIIELSSSSQNFQILSIHNIFIPRGWYKIVLMLIIRKHIFSYETVGHLTTITEVWNFITRWWAYVKMGENSDVSQTWWMKWARNLHVALIVLLLLNINFKLNFKKPNTTLTMVNPEHPYVIKLELTVSYNYKFSDSWTQITECWPEVR
jgi:hypothetical protein